MDWTVKLPSWGAWILRRLLPACDFGNLVGFYEKGYDELRRNRGRRAAALWLWAQILRAAPPLLGFKMMGEMIMLRNYLKTAVRNVLRHPGFSLINISGLALGLTCCLLILVWVKFELGFDRFHDNAGNIHQVVIQWKEGDNTRWAHVTPPPLAEALKSEFPEVREAVVMETQEKHLVEVGDQRYSEEVAYATPGLFRVFTVPLERGDPADVLSDPAAAVIDQETARKYFGNEDPLGRTLLISDKLTFHVTGVMRDLPKNSFFQCRILLPFRALELLQDRGKMNEWREYGFRTFLLLAENAEVAALRRKLDTYLEETQEEDSIRLSLQPLTRMHLYALGGAGGAILYVCIFTAVAVFILLIACINFMNLTTARSAIRMREIGVRKVVGADRTKLILQFLGESVFMALVSSLAALLMAWLLLKPLKQLAGIPPGFRAAGPEFLPLLVLAALGTGLLAGSYPAVVLSSFRPTSVLKGRQKSGSPLFRKVLVVFQFSISIFLLICMSLISRQIGFIDQKPLGFSKEHVVYVPINPDLLRQYEAVRVEMTKHPGVLHMSGISNYLGRGAKWSTETLDWEGKDPDFQLNVRLISVDYAFVDTFRIEMAEGRFFSREFESDTNNYILNETAVKELGIESPIGKYFQVWDERGTIVGVVKDFHFRSLRADVQPLILVHSRDWHSFLAVKVDARDIPASLAHIEDVFQEFSPKYTFEYRFLDETLDTLYRSETRSRALFRYFVVLAVFISCLGLFGLASFMVARRTKEIGVRKVLGAPASSIVLLLSGEYVRWVTAANLLAWPAAYVFINTWLRSFAYRISIGIDVFIYAALATLAVALLTVSVQTVKAAMADPIIALRYE